LSDGYGGRESRYGGDHSEKKKKWAHGNKEGVPWIGKTSVGGKGGRAEEKVSLQHLSRKESPKEGG